jgi:Flp pilus assembly protein TadD
VALDQEWWRMMVRARLIGFSRITVIAAVVACLCPSVCPVSAAGGDTVLSAQEWFDRGRFMGEIGNYRKAAEAFSRVIERAADSAHAYNNRGVAYSELGNFRLAIQDFNRAIHLNPDEALFRFNRGIAFGKAEEFDLAVQDFNRVLELDPRNTNARFFLGLIQRSMPGEVHKGSDNIKSSAHMGNKNAQEYLRSRHMGWY